MTTKRRAKERKRGCRDGSLGTKRAEANGIEVTAETDVKVKKPRSAWRKEDIMKMSSSDVRYAEGKRMRRG
jgi:hypothetical protein